MELHELDAAVVLLAHHRPGEPVGAEGLPDARSALQDDVLLVAQNRHQLLITLFGHVDVLEEIVLGVGLGLRLLDDGVLLTDEVEDKVVLAGR